MCKYYIVYGIVVLLRMFAIQHVCICVIHVCITIYTTLYTQYILYILHCTHIGMSIILYMVRHPYSVYV